MPPTTRVAPALDAGALFSYRAALEDQLRRSAQMVDKVRKGAQPADMAIEQLTRSRW